VSPPSKIQEPVAPQFDQSSESFIAVKGATQESVMPTSAASQPAINNQKFLLKKWLAFPRSIINYLFIVLLTIISLALSLKIFIKIKIQHPKLIVNGVILLIVISLLVWTNQHVALMQVKII